MSTIERRIEITPARDCHDGCVYGSERCRPGSGGYHGIHGSELRMYVIGPLGAVQFVVFTGWFWPETADRLKHDHPRAGLFEPMAADLGYHWLSPSEESKEWRIRTDGCDLYPDAPTCWYDGSGLNAEGVFETLVRHGIDAVWTRLEAEYATRIAGEVEAGS